MTKFFKPIWKKHFTCPKCGLPYGYANEEGIWIDHHNCKEDSKDIDYDREKEDPNQGA